MSSLRRVLVDAPPYPLDVVRKLLDGAGAEVDAPPRPWSGDDVVGLLIDRPVTEADFARLPALRVVATNSIGVDHIDLAAAARRQIWVCNVPDYCIDEVADTTIALLLALLRGTVVLDRSVRDGIWSDHAAGPLQRLDQTRLGIVGFGRIGRAVARRALALDFEVWANDPAVSPRVMTESGVHPAGLDDLLRSCTALTLHVALTEETRGLISKRELALMPPGSFLINVARGPVVDQAALLAALDSGHLAGAALDVLEVEPPTLEHPAPRNPHLIVTPHAAWRSPQADLEVYRHATLSVRAVLEGRVPERAVRLPSPKTPA
jgi:D-3-phosphoglycerate dehydrogenase / 2-oxoglutarate reductase